MIEESTQTTNDEMQEENPLADLAPLPQVAKRNPVAPQITPEDFEQNNALSEDERFNVALSDLLLQWNRKITAFVPFSELPGMFERALNAGRNDTHLQNPNWITIQKTK